MWLDETYKEIAHRTQEALLDPQVGDRFHEMYSFWVYVVSVVDNRVITMEANPPCEFPNDGKVWSGTKEEFKKRFYYDSIDEPWIMLSNRGSDVSGWV